MKKRSCVELKKRIDSRLIFGLACLMVAAVYIFVGLQPAEATRHIISANLTIPGINLSSDVTELKLENNSLPTPDTIVGSFSRAENKTLLIGHSTTVFSDLILAEVGEEIFYNQKTYHIIKMEIYEKNSISMNEVLRREDEDTLVIMTCAGESLGGGDATHRLIVTAVLV